MYKVFLSKVKGYKILWYDSVTSTNDIASEMAINNYPEGTVVISDFQTQGRGQRNNKWTSKSGENLMFSLILRPEFLHAENQFRLLKAMSLAVCDYINSKGITACIKWPNDIYVNNSKITGMLIEHSIMGEGIAFSVIGIGININQITFSNEALNPISLSQITGKQYNLLDELNTVLKYIDIRYTMLKNNQIAAQNTDYFNNLYRKKGFHVYEANGKQFKAQIVNILDNGELVLEDENKTIQHFAFKEVNFVL